jgi:uncharacterized coiled-coil protein SlyX
VIEMKMRLEHL